MKYHYNPVVNLTVYNFDIQKWKKQVQLYIHISI